tara:strand:- start:955 stop:1395 length:441 start_codon:yes stop_codon:yes gene_type:complete
MKITGPGQTDKTQKKDKPKKTGDSSFESMVSDTGGTQGSSGAGGAAKMSPAASLEALLALQGADDATTGGGKQRAKERADEMLDKLDEVRLGLLSGGISRAALSDLTRLLSEKREQFDDPRLTEIVEEIDLRAQVEIAKLEAASAR